jgi:hypothetical protein
VAAAIQLGVHPVTITNPSLQAADKRGSQAAVAWAPEPVWGVVAAAS